MTSAADIEVPEPQHNDIFSRIKRLIAAAGSDQNDQAFVAISALIMDEIDTRSQIMEMMIRLGFKRGHAGAILTKSTGINPDRHRWSLDKTTGRYSLHPVSE